MPDGMPPSRDGGRPGAVPDTDRPAPLRADWRDRPHPDRFAPDRPDHEPVMAAHRRAVERGDPGYLDPMTGLFVMTSVHLRDRGWCCDRGCRHCPYVGASSGSSATS